MLPIRRSAAAAALFALALVSNAIAAPVLGYREDFPAAGGVSTFIGGANLNNPGTGGAGGDLDGYLQVETLIAGNLGTVSFGPEYAGNWTAAGITQARLWLRDTGAANPLEVHFSIGLFGNFWQYNLGFAPPSDRWAEYVVDLSSSANWTHIDNASLSTFAAALAAVDRIHVRHDVAPYVKNPDPIAAGFGLDHILLTNGTVGVESGPASAQRAIELAPPSPNPSRGAVALAFTQHETGAARIEILDVSGRMVRRVELAESGPGPRLWMWDGRDAAGALAAPGVYHVRATGAAGGTSRTLVRVR